ncbi:MAG: bacteriohemerythrin [bacterium]|nr:bacteriohemerythrin [bacterium]
MSISVNLVEWSDKYSVHVSKIDSEHKQLFALLNIVNSAIVYGKGKEILEYALSELLSYTENHFQHEEEVMTMYNYPGLAMHRIEHKNLLLKVQTYIQKYHNKVLSVSEITTFLKGWLINHIEGDDSHFGNYLRGKGIS